MILLILSCICIGTAGGLAGWSLVTPSAAPPIAPKRPKPMPEPEIAPIDLDVVPTNLHEAMLARSRTERVVRPGIERLQEMGSRITPEGRLKALHEKAISAGMQTLWTRPRITTVKSIGLGLGTLMGLFLFAVMEGNMRWIMCAGAIALGYWALDIYLGGQASQRREQILGDLPDVTDQISISVQAGLGFENAIQRTAMSTEGPLSDELTRMLQDVRLGATRQAAFTAMADRAGVDDLSSFVRAISQAERSGVAIAQVLQVQADELREKRRQRAEERAMKMPVMLVFPLVTCILPPLFIVLMGPVVISIMEQGIL